MVLVVGHLLVSFPGSQLDGSTPRYDQRNVENSLESQANKQTMLILFTKAAFLYHYKLDLLVIFYFLIFISGILPANQDSHDFVLKNRTEQYNNLRHALDVMRKVNDNTPQPEIFLKMFLIEEGLLPFQDSDLVRHGCTLI